MNATAASKLLQASGMSSGSQSSTANSFKGNIGSPQRETNSVSGDTSSVCSDDENHSNSEVNCSIQSLPEFRSSVLEGEMLPAVSTRSVDEKTGNKGAVRSSGDSLKFPTTPFSRSLNPSLSGSEHLLNHSIRGSEKHVTSLVKQYANSAKVGGLCLPPVAPCPKPGVDTKKSKKGSNHQEIVHSLRLLYNRYLQWRFANAKAESSLKAQQGESEKALYSLALKMSELRDSVNLKRLEVQLLQRAKTLLIILEAQIPHLDEWSSLEVEYSISLTEAIEALLNASVQLPVGGNVKVDAREVGEAINSAMKMMESIVFHVQRFTSQVEETDLSISELARVVGGERAFIGECGSLLARAYKSQVEECSLRSQLMQIHSTGHKAKTVEL
ncbi:protein ENDOSPERM DEFECTIVE 1 [Neltuma alba]|uniref:protein ENDOSPERM DEFECTIVE 1 n=1 Tax=Neltuma alba TaxID=207710 RepID=UPI0010A2AA0F|nr:protein ENDOSPERM DEFECTIVE 1-like [Prosopis alba]